MVRRNERHARRCFVSAWHSGFMKGKREKKKTHVQEKCEAAHMQREKDTGSTPGEQNGVKSLRSQSSPDQRHTPPRRVAALMTQPPTMAGQGRPTPQPGRACSAPPPAAGTVVGAAGRRIRRTHRHTGRGSRVGKSRRGGGGAFREAELPLGGRALVRLALVVQSISAPKNTAVLAREGPPCPVRGEHGDLWWRTHQRRGPHRTASHSHCCSCFARIDEHIITRHLVA